MAEQVCRPVGLSRPRFFDRQVVLADDLSLEQVHHDRQVARLNRYLHGWGVVAGFDVALRAGKNEAVLVVEPGYALTPDGHEIYLPDTVSIDDLPGLARAAGCDCGEKGCDDLEPGKGEEPGTPVVYLVARPGTEPGSPRPAAPEGCGHPGSNMQYSRWCSQVCLEIVCKLEPPHVPTAPDCKSLQDLFCAPAAQRPVPPLPATVGDSLDYVVLAAISFESGEKAGKRAIFDPDVDPDQPVPVVSLEPRRVLFPVETLQHWLQCLCVLLREKPQEPPRPKPEDKPGSTPPVQDKPPGDVRPTRPEPPVTGGGPFVPTVVDPEPPVVSGPRDPIPDPTRPKPIDPEPPIVAGPVDPRPPGSFTDPAVIDPVVTRPDRPSTPVSGAAAELDIARPAAGGTAPSQPLRPSAGTGPAAPVSGATSVGGSVPVTEIAGVGPTRAARLEEAGVRTVRDFTALPVPQAASIMKVSESTAAGIMEKAQEVESTS